MSDVRIVFPGGLTPNQARRLADIADALQPVGATALVDLAAYDLDPPRCDCCSRLLEGGHCYACEPVMGYGKGFECEKCKDSRRFKRRR